MCKCLRKYFCNLYKLREIVHGKCVRAQLSLHVVSDRASSSAFVTQHCVFQRRTSVFHINASIV